MEEKKMLESLKKKCLKVWEKYKDNPGDYYQEKYERVMSVTHPSDAYYLVSMFDVFNQAELFWLLTKTEREYYKDLFVPLMETIGMVNELRTPMILD